MSHGVGVLSPNGCKRSSTDSCTMSPANCNAEEGNVLYYTDPPRDSNRCFRDDITDNIVAVFACIETYPFLRSHSISLRKKEY